MNEKGEVGKGTAAAFESKRVSKCHHDAKTDGLILLGLSKESKSVVETRARAATIDLILEGETIWHHPVAFGAMLEMNSGLSALAS